MGSGIHKKVRENQACTPIGLQTFILPIRTKGAEDIFMRRTTAARATSLHRGRVFPSAPGGERVMYIPRCFSFRIR